MIWRLAFLVLIFPAFVMGQPWKKYRKEEIYGVGVTNCLTDLGGADQIGTNYLKDLEFSATRYNVMYAYRYRVYPDLYVRGNAYIAQLRGDDKLTNEVFRNHRNLNFKTSIFEISGQAEYAFVKEKQGHRYQIKGVRGKRNINIQSYVFAGLGFFYFNPKGQYGPGGSWFSLQPLGTEGQGIDPGRKKYSRFNFCLPAGFGLRYGVSRTYTIGLEVGFRKTFTDYLDDASTTYYDVAKIKEQKGDIAAYFADPSSKEDASRSGWTAIGEQRGDPKDKDSYMFATVTLARKIRPKRTKAKF